MAGALGAKLRKKAWFAIVVVASLLVMVFHISSDELGELMPFTSSERFEPPEIDPSAAVSLGGQWYQMPKRVLKFRSLDPRLLRRLRSWSLGDHPGSMMTVKTPAGNYGTFSYADLTLSVRLEDKHSPWDRCRSAVRDWTGLRLP